MTGVFASSKRKVKILSDVGVEQSAVRAREKKNYVPELKHTPRRSRPQNFPRPQRGRKRIEH